MECLSRDPDASVADIAQAAGVGRVSLYGHFASREELLDAVFARAMREADAALDSLDLDGDPRQAMTLLIRTPGGSSTGRARLAITGILLAAFTPPGHPVPTADRADTGD